MFRASAGFRQMLAGPDLAIDVGTANTRLRVQGQGVVADEPSVPVWDTTETPGAVADGVLRRMTGGPRNSPVFPVRAGAVVDADAAAAAI